jgi:hypothetical protein
LKGHVVTTVKEERSDHAPLLGVLPHLALSHAANIHFPFYRRFDQGMDAAIAKFSWIRIRKPRTALIMEAELGFAALLRPCSTIFEHYIAPTSA